MSDIAAILAANENISKDTLQSHADRIDRERKFPRENLQALGAAGVLGILIPAEFGGAGGTLADMSRALQAQAQGCASTAMVALMHYCACAVIAAKGGDAMKRQLLPSAARGEHISTLAFSEAGSGGHFYAPVSKVRLDCGAKKLSARKTFVTSAGEADSYVVSTRALHAAAPTECDLYLIPKGASGFSAQGRFEGLGLAGNASAPMTLEDDDGSRAAPLSDRRRVGIDRDCRRGIREDHGAGRREEIRARRRSRAGVHSARAIPRSGDGHRVELGARVPRRNDSQGACGRSGRDARRAGRKGKGG